MTYLKKILIFLEDRGIIKKLLEEHKKYLVGPILTYEIHNTMKSLKNNKTTGPDGFQREFYKTFSVDLKFLEELFNKVLYI